MSFEPVSSTARSVLSELVNKKNPTKLLCDKYDLIPSKEREQFCSHLGELEKHGLVKIKWANNKPYQVIVTASGRAYEENLAEYKKETNREPATNISIGDNNRISNSVITGIISSNEPLKKRSFYERHPILIGFLISLAAGIVLLFSFWNKIVEIIERFF